MAKRKTKKQKFQEDLQKLIKDGKSVNEAKEITFKKLKSKDSDKE